MFPDTPDGRLLVLGRDPDTDLLALLRTWYPSARFALERGELSAWLGSLWHQPPDGLVLFTDRLEPAELQALGAWLHEHPQLPVLLVTGSRGVFGAEAILAHPALRTLPTPWSAPGLRLVLGRSMPAASPESASPAASAPVTVAPPAPAEPVPSSEAAQEAKGTPTADELHAFAGDFLDGLIERVRDPLASLSGYLQLLQAEGDETADILVRPALEAARELDGVLDALHLASDGWSPHPSRHAGERLAVEALKEAQRAGFEVAFGDADEFVVRVDPRLTTAALSTARVLLTRFGGGGDLQLHCQKDADQVAITWSLRDAPTVPAGTTVEIPAFLRLLLGRFAERCGALAVLESTRGGVPRRAGLRWPLAATVPASS